MKAVWFWALGCFFFAAISAYLAVDRAGFGFAAYGNQIKHNFVSSQRDAMFKIVPELRPRLQADQIEAAAKAAKLSVERREGSLNVIGGIEFTLTGTEVSSVRSTNF